MPKIIKNTLFQYLPDYFEIEKEVNRHRIFEINNNPLLKGTIIYICERALRINDNFALQFAIQKSKELNYPLKILHPKINYECLPKQKFIDEQINITKENYKKSELDFEIYEGDLKDYIKTVGPACLIIDFNPILNRNWLKNMPFKVYEIDSHNIIPARFISNHREYNAATLRRKIYYNIYPFITESEDKTFYRTQADMVLESFIKNKLPYYAEFKNDPVKNVTSGLSKYINLGFISSQRIALEIIKSDVSAQNKEAFLEELIIRKELADNFCLYCKNFKDYSCIPDWAKKSLREHWTDIRPYIYNLEEFEKAKTHDELWNATQKQLIKEGTIHGYLRMYWAKKIIEWSENPDIALKTAVYLNNKYAFDSPSPSGYVNILWSMAGLHDRAFGDFFITGKIRRMSFNSIKKKFDIQKYINLYN